MFFRTFAERGKGRKVVLALRKKEPFNDTFDLLSDLNFLSENWSNPPHLCSNEKLLFARKI